MNSQVAQLLAQSSQKSQLRKRNKISPEKSKLEKFVNADNSEPEPESDWEDVQSDPRKNEEYLSCV